MPDRTNTPSLSALIITYNEIGNIERCLNAIRFVSEIIVVDSYSTDGTYEYLKSRPGVRVIQRAFTNFTDQKNFALQQASYDWVLFVDADEVVEANLQEEILDTLRTNRGDIHAYWFYRNFMFGEKPLRFSGWQTDKNIRLFRRSKANYSHARLVHERLEITGRTDALSERLTHYCYQGFDHYRRKMLMYGRLKGSEAFQANKRFTWARQVLKPLWKFSYNYLIRLGFLDGLNGLKICYLGALEDVERYRHLRQLEMESRRVAIQPPMEHVPGA